MFSFINKEEDDVGVSVEEDVGVAVVSDEAEAGDEGVSAIDEGVSAE